VAPSTDRPSCGPEQLKYQAQHYKEDIEGPQDRDTDEETSNQEDDTRDDHQSLQTVNTRVA
jgi:hypothetical protein